MLLCKVKKKSFLYQPTINVIEFIYLKFWMEVVIILIFYVHIAAVLYIEPYMSGCMGAVAPHVFMGKTTHPIAVYLL